jgi:hypothetical protein
MVRFIRVLWSLLSTGHIIQQVMDLLVYTTSECNEVFDKVILMDGKFMKTVTR